MGRHPLLALLILTSCWESAAQDAAPEPPPRPMRILPANTGVFELVAELVEKERIAAVPEVVFTWSSLPGGREAWEGIPVMGRFTGEELLALDPDQVLVHHYQFQASGALSQAREVRIPVVELPDPSSWEDLLAGVRQAGEALGERERAGELTRELEERRRALAATDRRAISILPYANYGSGGWTAGPGTTVGLAIELAGLRNAAERDGLRGPAEISLEEVLAIAPDAFLCSSGVAGVSAGAEYLRNERILAELEAVREGRIVVLDAGLYSAASQRVLDAAEELARQIDALEWE